MTINLTRSGLAVMALFATSLAAQAADMRVKAPPKEFPAPVVAPSWSGLYVGLGVGMRSTQADGSVSSGTNTFPSGAAPVNLFGPAGSNCAVFACTSSEPLNNTAFRIAPYAGLNWQLSPLTVVGIEGDWGSASRTTTLGGANYPGGGSPFFITGRGDDTFSVKTTWDASLRGRIGLLANPTLLFYATGGVAWLHIEATSTCGNLSFCNPPNATGFAPGTITNSTTKTGWTIGGGLEAMLWGNWLARAEYRYADFGTVTYSDTRSCPAAGCGVVTNQTVVYNIRATTHTATLGLAYKFDWGGPIRAGY